MKNLLERFVVNETAKYESATQRGVAAYLVYLKLNGKDAIKHLRTILKENGVLTEANKGSVNKNIKTAVAILESHAEEVASAFLNAENDWKKTFAIIVELIQTNSWTYYTLVQQKPKLQSPKDSKVKTMEVFKNFYKFLKDPETNSLMIDLLSENGLLLIEKTKSKAA